MKYFYSFIAVITIFIFLGYNNLEAVESIVLNSSLDRSSMNIRETLKYTVYSGIEYNGGEDIPEIRGIPGFTIIKTYSDIIAGSNSFRFSDQKTTRITSSSNSRIYNFILKPLKTGVLKIGPFTIFLNGKKYVIARQIVKVTEEEAEISRGLKNIVKRPSVFLTTSVSDSNCYVNQPIYVDYKLFYSVPVKIKSEPKFRDSIGLKLVKILDFYSSGIISGKEYNSYTIRKYYFPSTDGIIHIPPVEYSLLTNYSELLNSGNSEILTSHEITIKVKKNSENVTDNLVSDNIEIINAVMPDTLYSGRLFHITLSLAGKFNPAALNNVKPVLPEKFELLNTEDTFLITADSSGYFCIKAFKFSIIGYNTGNYNLKIEPVEYFSYKYMSVKKIEFVSKVKIENGISDTGIFQTENIPVQKNISDSDIFNKNFFFGYNIKNIFKRILYFAILALFTAIILKLFFYCRTTLKKLRKNIDDSATKRNARRNALKNISELKNELLSNENIVSAYGRLYKILLKYLAAKREKKNPDFSIDDVCKMLAEKNIDKPGISGIRILHEKFCLNEYSPEKTISPNFEYNDLNDFIEFIARIINKYEENTHN